MENNTITRIADLPDLGGISQQQQPPSTTYQPMLNVHPNPYGIQQPQGGGLPPPIQTQEGSKQHQNPMYSPNDIPQIAPVNRLPQRDIPMMMEDYTHDEQIQPSYIPKPRQTKDYIDEYQQSTDRKLKEYEAKKRADNVKESWFDELRIPIMISIIFFIFNMPIINTIIFKKFSFLSIYNDDGNFNIYGLFFKSLCFGSAYYMINRAMDFLSDI